MRIKKVYIKNFKGVNDKKVIDFESRSSLLMGPNGFGKTTIFDALELCLTGKIHRTTLKDGVTNHSSDYKKPFFQNEKGKDVIIKVWLSKIEHDTEKDFIITKFLPKNHAGRSGSSGRRNKPNDFDLLRTYKESVVNFAESDFNPSEAELINQKNINAFFGFKEDSFKIEHIYNLFNYLQQEETTLFLKLTERERKSTLGFLFQTSIQEDELRDMSATLSKLTNIQEELKQKIEKVEKIEEINKVKHDTIFPEGKFDFDQKDLFHNIGVAESNELKKTYNKELDNILRFTKVFSPDEYEKAQTIKVIDNKKINTDLIDFYPLQNFMEKENYESIKQQFDLLGDDVRLKAFILQTCTLKHQHYSDINSNIDEYETFLKTQDLNTRLDSIKPFVEKFKPELMNSYEYVTKSRNQLMATTKEIDLTINEIIQMRDSLRKKIEKDTSDIIKDGTCPYCGTEWETAEELLNNFKEREKTLKSLSNDQTSRLSEYEERLEEDFVKPIVELMNDYLEKNKITDSKIINHLRDFKEKVFNFSVLDNYHFNTPMVWSKPQSHDDLLIAVSELKKLIKSKITVSVEVFQKMNQLNNISFETDIKLLGKLVSKDDMKKSVLLDFSKNVSLSDHKEKVKLLLEFLEASKEQYKYDHEKIQDKENIYGRYFDNDKQKLKEFNDTKIHQKKQYIEYSFSRKHSNLLGKYKSRFNKLKQVIDKLEPTKELYGSMIKSHKKEMSDKIKVPFYIYTAKILQNYQQGMGVFLSTGEGKDTIRFLTDQSTDHDASHHLSSGQLAVVSLAFTLAINKTYNISDNLRILTIDDPIQEMDALNIHSFIELIRHEFLKEYQLIFSTHSDATALYMKYKLEKMIEDPVLMIDVQNELFN